LKSPDWIRRDRDGGLRCDAIVTACSQAANFLSVAVQLYAISLSRVSDPAARASWPKRRKTGGAIEIADRADANVT